MLTETEYAQQQVSLGRRIHGHDGVWWDEQYPFYCKPAFIYRAFDPGSARPARRRSLLGYSHQVTTPEKGNRHAAFMVLEGERLRMFSLSTIDGYKRNRVRKGLKSCAVRLIDAIEPNLEKMRQINIDQALRQAARAGSETPVHRYIAEADSWRTQVRAEFALRGREWWGAFVDNALAAYIVTYQVDTTRVIEKVKSHSDYLKYCVVDALHFVLLEAASNETSCLRVIHGRPQHESLNQYKEQFLFRSKEFPYYSTHARLVECAKHVSALRDRMTNRTAQ